MFQVLRALSTRQRASWRPGGCDRADSRSLHVALELCRSRYCAQYPTVFSKFADRASVPVGLVVQPDPLRSLARSTVGPNCRRSTSYRRIEVTCARRTAPGCARSRTIPRRTPPSASADVEIRRHHSRAADHDVRSRAGARRFSVHPRAEPRLVEEPIGSAMRSRRSRMMRSRASARTRRARCHGCES
jgi:hypothetical protein